MLFRVPTDVNICGLRKPYIKHMLCGMSSADEVFCQCWRQLIVDEELHAD